MEYKKFQAMVERSQDRTWSDRFGKGEIEMLREIIEDDEEILYIVQGTFSPELQQGHGRRGIAVATSKRILFLDKGVWGSSETAEMQYDKVTSVTHSTGMMLGGIKINGFGNSGFQIESVAKEQTNEFADVVRQMGEHAKQTELNSETSKHDETVDLLRLQLDELREVKALLAKPCPCCE